MDLGIKGKRAIILGASKGIGFASASALAAEGGYAVVSSSSMERAEEAAAKKSSRKQVARPFQWSATCPAPIT